MDTERYLVSAIISTYNSERFIRGKIEDLLNQTIVDRLEIVIVNSGSQQNEDTIIKEYLKKYNNIKYIKTDVRETIYKAWNRGIRISKGKYITNANTDDRLKSNAYEILSAELENNQEIALVYADQYISDTPNENYNAAKKNRIINFPNYQIIHQLERCIIGSQPMWRANLHFLDDIWFDESFEVCGDHDFELKVSHKYLIKHINISLGVFFKSKHRTNKEFENMDRNLRELRKIQKYHFPIYLKSLSNTEISGFLNHYKKYIWTPLALLFLIKRLQNYSKNIYPKFFFHSPEFLYYFYILLLKTLDKKFDAEILAQRYLEFRKSELILSTLELHSNEKNE